MHEITKDPRFSIITVRTLVLANKKDKIIVILIVLFSNAYYDFLEKCIPSSEWSKYDICIKYNQSSSR